MNDDKELLDLIRNGVASEKDQGAALKAIQTSMTLTMSLGVKNVMNSMSRMSALLDKAIDRYNNKFGTLLDSDAASVDEMMDYINTVQTKQIQLMDLYRKIVQGRDMFAESGLSDNERMVLSLFKSFKTEEQKIKFINMCKDLLNEGDS